MRPPRVALPTRWFSLRPLSLTPRALELLEEDSDPIGLATLLPEPLLLTEPLSTEAEPFLVLEELLEEERLLSWTVGEEDVDLEEVLLRDVAALLLEVVELLLEVVALLLEVVALLLEAVALLLEEERLLSWEPETEEELLVVDEELPDEEPLWVEVVLLPLEERLA